MPRAKQIELLLHAHQPPAINVHGFQHTRRQPAPTGEEDAGPRQRKRKGEGGPEEEFLDPCPGPSQAGGERNGLAKWGVGTLDLTKIYYAFAAVGARRSKPLQQLKSTAPCGTQELERTAHGQTHCPRDSQEFKHHCASCSGFRTDRARCTSSKALPTLQRRVRNPCTAKQIAVPDAKG